MRFEVIETGLGLNWFKVDKYLRPNRCRPVFPSPVRFFPKKEISEDWTGPGLVQKRIKNRTRPDLETLNVRVCHLGPASVPGSVAMWMVWVTWCVAPCGVWAQGVCSRN